MNEAKRIFSGRRLMTILCIPLICLIVFFYQKCGGQFQNLVPDATEYRSLLETYADTPWDKIVLTLEGVQNSQQENDLYNQAKYLDSYGDYLTRVQDQASRMQMSSLFGGDPNSFTYRNIIKTAKDFQGVSSDNVSLGNDRAVKSWLAFSAADWFYFAAILIIVMAFLEERQKGLDAIIRTCSGGRAKLQLSRLCILAAYATAMTLLVYFLPLGLSLALDGGWSDLGRPLQSLSEFQKCTTALTILEFLGQYFLVKSLCGFLLGVLIWFALSFLARPQMCWLVTAVVLVIEYLLYILIPAQSIFSLLREINVFSYVFTFALYTQYTNINIFGFPIGRRTLLMGLLLIASAALSGATVVILSRRYPFGNRDLLGKWIDRWNRANDRLRRHLHLYGFEVYKLLFLSAGGLFLIMGILITRDLSCGTTAYLSTDDNIYRQYVQEIQGPVTQDTYDYLDRAHQALQDSTMDTLSYEMALDRLEQTLSSLNDGAWLVYDALFMNCFGIRSATTQRENALLAYIFLAACLSPLFSCEQSGDVRKVLRSAPGGRQRLFGAKYVTALTITVLVWLRVMCQEWLLAVNYIGATTIAAPSCSIAMIENFPTSVGGSLAILYLFKLLAMLIPMHLCIFIGVNCKGFDKAFLVSALFLLVPAAALYFGADAVAPFTPASLLADASPIFYTSKGFIIFGVWMVLSLLALWCAKRSWCRTK